MSQWNHNDRRDDRHHQRPPRDDRDRDYHGGQGHSRDDRDRNHYGQVPHGGGYSQPPPRDDRHRDNHGYPHHGGGHGQPSARDHYAQPPSRDDRQRDHYNQPQSRDDRHRGHYGQAPPREDRYHGGAPSQYPPNQPMHRGDYSRPPHDDRDISRSDHGSRQDNHPRGDLSRKENYRRDDHYAGHHSRDDRHHRDEFSSDAKRSRYDNQPQRGRGDGRGFSRGDGGRGRGSFVRGGGADSLVPFLGSEQGRCDGCGREAPVGGHEDVPDRKMCSACWDRHWSETDSRVRKDLMASEREALRRRPKCTTASWNAVGITMQQAQVYMYPCIVEKNDTMSEVQRKKLMGTYLRQVLGKETYKSLDIIVSGAIFYCAEDISDKLQEPLNRVITIGSFSTSVNLRKEDITHLQLDPLTNELQTMQIYSHVLSKILESFGLRRTGKMYCDYTRQRVYRDMIIVPGYFATFQVTGDRVVLIVHPRTHVEARMTALDFMKKNGPLSLQGTRVMTTYGTRKRNYVVYKVDRDSTVNSTFELKTNRTITFAEYYKESYGLSVRDQNQPMLWGDRDGHTKLVPEFVLVDQLSAEARRHLPSRCSKMPSELQNECMSLVKKFGTESSRKLLSVYGLDVRCAELETVTPKEMRPVRVRLAGTTETLRPHCDFAQQTMNVKFDVERHEYIVFIWGTRAQALARQIMDINERIRGAWKQRGDPVYVDGNENQRDFISKCLTSIQSPEVERDLADGHRALVLCALENGHSNEGQDTYATLKCALGERGIVSQFVDYDKLSKARTSGPYIHNITKNITGKLGIPIWDVSLSTNVPEVAEGGTLYVGYDIYTDRRTQATESGSFENMRRNLSGFVAWYHRSDGQWLHLSNTDMQVSRQRMQGAAPEPRKPEDAPQDEGPASRPVVDASDMLSLEEFLFEVFDVVIKDSDIRRVVVYRDGVGDSMMERVRTGEMAGCKTFLEERNIDLVFLVVQKRVHDRYTSSSRRGPTTEWHNIPRGHVVEHTETSFSQISVDSTLATSRPVKYFVLASGSLSIDAIQNLTYSLCWMYMNWPGSIKVPFVLQCAGKLAFFHGTSSASKPNAPLSLRQIPYYL